MIKVPSAKDKVVFETFNAVCRDCGNIRDESYDHKSCECGGVYHVDSARCLACGKRHPFSMAGQKCSCEAQGEIVAKMVSCPSCRSNMKIDHLGETCPNCKVNLVMEG